MRSSKWLVFIRSPLAGFDRSLTKRYNVEAAEAEAERRSRVRPRIGARSALAGADALLLHWGSDKNRTGPSVNEKLNQIKAN